jgi:hypothetical protein
VQVTECLAKYESLLNQVSSDEKQKIQRGMGMKMEQLKGELSTVEDKANHDH